MTGANRTAVAVTFLANDEEARRMVLAWPLVDADLEDASALRAWARAAGVPASRARRIADVLLCHEICKADGSVDAEAIRVIEHVAAESLRKRGKR